MNKPEYDADFPTPPPWIKTAVIAVTVFALVGITFVVLAGVFFSIAMRSWGNNK